MGIKEGDILVLYCFTGCLVEGGLFNLFGRGFGHCLILRKENGFFMPLIFQLVFNPVCKMLHLISKASFCSFWKGRALVNVSCLYQTLKLLILESVTLQIWFLKSLDLKNVGPFKCWTSKIWPSEWWPRR